MVTCLEILVFIQYSFYIFILKRMFLFQPLVLDRIRKLFEFSVGAQSHKQLLDLMEQIVDGKGKKEDGGGTWESANGDKSETCFISVVNTTDSSLCLPATSSSSTHFDPAVTWILIVGLHSECLETFDVKNGNNNNFLTIFLHLDDQLHLQDKISNFNHSDTTFKSPSPRKKKKGVLSFNYAKGYS